MIGLAIVVLAVGAVVYLLFGRLEITDSDMFICHGTWALSQHFYEGKPPCPQCETDRAATTRTTSERSRNDIDRAYGDAVYDAWRRGLDSDAVSRERVEDNYYQTYDRESAASMEVVRLARKRDERRQQQAQEQEFERERWESLEAGDPQ